MVWFHVLEVRVGGEGSDQYGTRRVEAMINTVSSAVRRTKNRGEDAYFRRVPVTVRASLNASDAVLFLALSRGGRACWEMVSVCCREKLWGGRMSEMTRFSIPYYKDEEHYLVVALWFWGLVLVGT